MKPIVLADLMNIIEYEKVRKNYRADIVAFKKHRRISLGPNITVTFENRKTMMFQIQEMMRAERMVHDHQIEEEIAVYNSLLPMKDCLSATLFIEVTEESQIRSVLNRFIGLTKRESVYFKVGGATIPAKFEAGREEEDKISSIHYVQFQFNAEAVTLFQDQDRPVELVIDYKDYNYKYLLGDAERQSLLADLLTN